MYGNGLFLYVCTYQLNKTTKVMTTQLKKLYEALNILNYSGRSTGQLAHHVIEATFHLRSAIEVILLDELECRFQEISKNTMIVTIDEISQEFRVGNFFMFEAFIKTGDHQNLGGVFLNVQDALKFVADLEENEKQLSDHLDECEKLHP